MFDLTCELTTAGSEVAVRYQGLNGTRDVVFVAHLPIDVTFKPYGGAAYTALSLDGQRLNLILGTSPLPYDRDVEYGVSALSVKVLPGERVSGEVHLSVPVNEWDAYYLPWEGVESELVNVKQIALAIEVIPQSKVTRLQEAKDQPGYLHVVGAATRYTCLIKSETLISVRKRRDNFPRSE